MAEVDQTSPHQETALHVAASRDAPAIVMQRLLFAGAVLESRTANNSTPLHVAAEAGRFVSENGQAMMVNGQKKFVPLACCSYILWLGSPQRAVRELLEAGADPNVANDIGNTPLHRAARNNHVEVARLLLGECAV